MSKILKNVFNIPGSCSFWDTIAEIYIDKFKDKKFELGSVLFMVPNRRACTALMNAFLRYFGLKPTILPQIVPISEIDDDEMFFSAFNLENIWPDLDLSISKEERLFLFARLIKSKPNDFGIKQLSPAQALSLAGDLASLIDTAYNQELSFDNLYNLVPEKYATHWQETLKLLKIITQYWPEILKERKAIDTSFMKNYVLSKQADLWLKENTQKHIVVAGVTASFPSIVKMMKTIQQLPNGKIYFSGIDKIADDKYWDAIDETHPQYELKDLLEKLEINRFDTLDIKEEINKDREQLVSEIMRPAIVSDVWRNIYNKFNLPNAINGIETITLKTQQEEALAIALKMRETLNYPEKTAALVTYDRALARRVSNELKRFGIIVDDSAGIPFSLCPSGVFLRLIAEASLDLYSKARILDLLKHPLTLLKNNPNDFRKKVYDLELCLRQKNAKPIIDNDQYPFYNNLIEHLEEFSKTLENPKIDFSEALKLHISIAEKIASSDTLDGKNFIWRGDEGKIGVKFISKMLEYSSLIGEIDGKDYLPMLCQLMSNETVRTNHGTHPRLSILGPIEAHLQNFDFIIIGEVNEGIWPKIPDADMWMSRPMMKDFGFSLPEKNIGILGTIFANFLKTKNVILTRAERIGESPAQKSRWWLRIETVLKALNMSINDIENKFFPIIANKIDTPLSYTPIKAPAPTPIAKSRPRKLSASGVDLLINDPYSAYAKYILKLYPLDDLDKKPDQRDYGTLIHGIVEEFNNTYNSKLPDNPLEKIIEIGTKHFEKINLDKDIKAFWYPKFLTTAEWIIEQELEYRKDVKKVHNEIEGKIEYNIQGGPFVFTAKADRIDELTDNTINILDYKTGSIPTKAQIHSGHAIQLLLEGLIARKKAYLLSSTGKVSSLIYWRLGKEKLEINEDVDDLLDKTEEYLVKLMNTFDFETTPYHSRPTPKYIPKNKDYEHLARIKEWSVQEDGENSDE